MLLAPERQGHIVFDILSNDCHKPLVDGKCNVDNVEEQLTMGILAGVLPAMDQEDVDLIITMVNELIVEFGEKK